VGEAVAKQNEHGKLIAAAAKAALLPLGFRRKGQSRCWYSDERFWYILIEFQPSAWSKGTYTNVTPIWFFLRHVTGDGAHRLADYIEFESVEQFTPLIEQMAKLAAAEAVALRTKFKTPLDVHRYFASRVTNKPSRIHCAAITAGLVGDFDSARQLFARIEAMDPAKCGPWLRDYQKECAALSALLDNPAGYRSAVLETITMQRQNCSFPPDPRCLESLDLG
jgi:hypothetical protein